MKPPLMTLPRALVELAFRGLDDARAEIEAMEKQNEWYCASQKTIDRIERASDMLEEELKK